MALPNNLADKLMHHMQTNDEVVGFSEDLHDGKIRIYVKSDADVRAAAAEFDGHPAEHMAVGEPVDAAVAVTPAPQAQKVTPLTGGISIGPAGEESAGTLGFFAQDGKKQVGLLTSGHVLPAGGPTDVWQPSKLDGGSGSDSCATLATSLYDPDREVDAAFAVLKKQEDYTKDIPGIGTVTGTRAAVKDDPVKKAGRTTDVTTGTVTDINATVQIGGTETWRNQILIRGPKDTSKAGDSGSVIVGEDKKVVGLLKATGDSGRSTWANHISVVEARLGVTVI